MKLKEIVAIVASVNGSLALGSIDATTQEIIMENHRINDLIGSSVDAKDLQICHNDSHDNSHSDNHGDNHDDSCVYT